MSKTCFIAYHAEDLHVARQIATALENCGIEIFMYAPGDKWSDPATLVVEAIGEVDFIAYVERREQREWIKAELDWAEKNHRQIVPLKKSSIPEIPDILSRVTNAGPSEFRRGDRFVEAFRTFRDRIAEDDTFSSDFFNREDWAIYQAMQDKDGLHDKADVFRKVGRWAKILSLVCVAIAILLGVFGQSYYLIVGMLSGLAFVTYKYFQLTAGQCYAMIQAILLEYFIAAENIIRYDEIAYETHGPGWKKRCSGTLNPLFAMTSLVPELQLSGLARLRSLREEVK